MAKPTIKKGESKEDFKIRLEAYTAEQELLDPSQRDAENLEEVSIAEVKERIVTFMPFQDHKCTIGGVQIILQKEIEVKVLESHARILAHSKKGYAK